MVLGKRAQMLLSLMLLGVIFIILIIAVLPVLSSGLNSIPSMANLGSVEKFFLYIIPFVFAGVGLIYVYFFVYGGSSQ